MPPALERLLEMVGQVARGWQAERSGLKEVVEWALQRDGRGGKGSLDEEKIFIRDGELFG